MLFKKVIRVIKKKNWRDRVKRSSSPIIQRVEVVINSRPKNL